jgi:hypothetical protein
MDPLAMSGMSAVDWFGLVVPYAVFFVMLIAYYVLEGRRERRLRRRYDEGRDRSEAGWDREEGDYAE